MRRQPKLQLAANTCFAVKRWPQPQAWLRLLQDWRLTAVQFSLDLLDPLQPQAEAIAREAGAACRESGVLVLSTFTGGRAYLGSMLLHPDQRYRDWAKSWLEASVAVTAAIGAPAAGGHLGALPEGLTPAGRLGLLDQLARAGTALGVRAHDAGLDYLLLELMPGPGEIPGTPAEALDILTSLNAKSPVPYYLCFDLGHACGAGAAAEGPAVLYAWLEQLLPVTRCVHLQQTDGRGDRHWPFAGRHAADGIVEPRRIIDILEHSPLPEVDLVLELLHPPEVPAAEIASDWAASAAVWRDALAGRGGN